MGKPTGFMEYKREVSVAEDPKKRIQHFNEFHEHLPKENQRELVKLLRRIKKELPQKTVWSFSGYTYEELTGDSRAVCEVTKEMLSMLDVLVDGEFVEAKRNISLRFRGSENQRLIDMNKTRKEGKIVLWDK